MSQPTFADAIARRPVRLPDGAGGHLWSISHRRGLARVELPSRELITVDLDDIELTKETGR